MRKRFHQFFRPTQSELKQLWAEGIFSFDASVLLNVYGYSSDTSEELVSVVEQIAQRVQIPFQFGLEYCRNRSVVILKQVSNYQRVEKSLTQIKDTDLAPKRDHPFLSPESMDAFEKIRRELAEGRKRMERLIGDDPLSERILAAFEGRVGPAPTEQELARLHSEAQIRYDKLIPPGFADLKDKGVPDAYGDYIGWSQLIAISVEQQKGVILVTDDFKEDWWRIERDRTVAPRPELLAEFSQNAQHLFYMYTSENFLRTANEYLATGIGEEAIEEVSQRLASQKLLQRTSDQKNTAEKDTGPATGPGGIASPEKITDELKEGAFGREEYSADQLKNVGAKVEDSHGS